MSGTPLAQKTPYAVSPPQYSVSHQMVTTALELPNYRITQNLGVVRGIVVRSRNIFATIGAGMQMIVGGNITVWTKLCEQTRADAFDIMIQHATEIGANAIVAARYDANEDMLTVFDTTQMPHRAKSILVAAISLHCPFALVQFDIK